MKTLLNILLLFCSFVSYSQTSFSDTLVIYTGFGSEQVILNNDYTFKYRDNSCTYHNEGVGLYAIENDKLILLFETPKVINGKTIRLSTFQFNNIQSDSINKVNFEFCISDSDNTPLDKATIVLKKLRRGTNSKNNGSAKIVNIEKNQFVQVEVSYVGMNTCIFNLFTDTSKYIEVKMGNKNISEINWLESGYMKEFKIINRIPYDECYYLQNKKGTLFLINERY